ncbi:hypothetical protein GTO84_01930 [Ligilactobacillus salivarius]|uniref:ABC-three component system protein n=1 Tax=Ligilactobacillus salivarius TaxID=1624 RepID=UPI0015DF216E|nr:ABC-three component system protein [Ligilactobacillus salivarius]QLL71414.1 hypothetical protein GTO84_01930 [Ligilactobacillus salivarius]
MKFNELAPLVRPCFSHEISKSKAKTVKEMFKLITDYGPDEEQPYDLAEVTLRNYFNKGNISDLASKVWKRINRTEFEETLKMASEDARTALANSIKEGNYTTKRVDRGTVAHVCTDIFIEIIAEAAGQISIKNKKSFPVTKESKIDIRTGKHQSIEYIKDKNVIRVDGVDHPISPELSAGNSDVATDLPYKNALYEIYSIRLGKKISNENLSGEAPRNIVHHFQRQQRDFNDAAWYERSLRDTVADFDNQFGLLKKDAYDGIEETYYNDEYGNNGMKRLREVQDKIITIALDLSNLKNIDNILSNNIKKGLCHLMVNDRWIKSWVDINGD